MGGPPFWAIVVFILLPGFLLGIPFGIWLRKRKGSNHNFIYPIAAGCVFAFFIGPLAITIFFKTQEAFFNQKVKKESDFYKSALVGKYSDKELMDHYKKNPLKWEVSHHTTRWFGSLLAEDYKYKPITSRIALLADLAASEKGVVNTLGALPNAPLQLKLKVAEDSKSYADLMAKEISTPPEVLIKLAANSFNNHTDKLILDHPNSPAVIPYIIAINRSRRQVDLPYSYSERTTAPKYSTALEKEAWNYFAKHNKPEFVIGISRHPEATHEFLNYIATHNSTPMVLAIVYLNNNASVKTVDYILKQYPNVINTILQQSVDRHSDIKMDIAISKRSTPQMLENLITYAYSNFHDVFYEIAKNTNVTPGILERLSHQNYSDVRKLVASNPKSPRNVLDNLSNDEDFEVSRSAKETLKKQ